MRAGTDQATVDQRFSSTRAPSRAIWPSFSIGALCGLWRRRRTYRLLDGIRDPGHRKCLSCRKPAELELLLIVDDRILGYLPQKSQLILQPPEVGDDSPEMALCEELLR